MRTALVHRFTATYEECGDHALVTVDERLDMEGMLAELSVLTTQAARIRWQPPAELRPGPNAILFYECASAKRPVEYAIIGSDLHYRLRPGMDLDTALKRITEAITEAAAVQGWHPLDANHRAAG